MTTTPAPAPATTEADEVGEAILADLRSNAQELIEASERVDALRARREELWVAGRAGTPPVTMRALAEASSVSEPLVIRTMTAHRKKNGG